MEAMPLDERIKSLAFSNAMTALEGIPASVEIENNLSLWANGDFSFQESYLNTLRTYHLAEV
jgi:serine protease inhibitor